MQGQIALSLHILAVNDYIAQLHQFPADGMQKQVFKTIARIAPDGLVGPFLNHSGQLDEAFGMEHWVAPGKGYVHVRFHNTGKQFLYANGLAALFVP